MLPGIEIPTSRSVFLKMGGIVPLGAIVMGKGAKKHQRGENAQPLIDHWVNLSILLLWLISSLQILIYYDNRWRLLLKQFICWIFTLACLCAQRQGGLFQGGGVTIKMSQLRLHSSSFHEQCSGSGALGFHGCDSGSGALFFHGSGSSSGFCSYLHINILIVLVCLKLIMENKLNQVHKIWRIYSTKKEISEKTTITGSNDSENSS